MPYPQILAGNGDQGDFQPFQLFAGEKEIVTAHDPVAAGVSIEQFAIIAKNPAGALVKWVPAASDSTGKALGVAAQPIVAAPAGASLPYYVSAFFNHEALVWPAAIDTLPERKAAFVGTEIQVGTLYG